MRFQASHRCGFRKSVDGFDREAAQEKANADHSFLYPNCPGTPDLVANPNPLLDEPEPQVDEPQEELYP